MSAYRSWRALRQLERGLFVALTLGALGALVTTPRWTVDDAFIVQRYAQNWVEHGVLSWNLGEPHVEGYTGIVLPCIYALAAWLGVPGPTLAVVVGGASLFGAAGVVAASVRELRGPPPSAAIAYGLYLSTAEAYTHAVSGLETSLFSCGLSLTIYGLLRALRERDWEWPFVLFAAVTALTRPEGVATSLVAVLALAFVRARSGQLRGFLGRALLGFALPVAAHLVFRLVYYHAWLPNTYYAKLSGGGNRLYFSNWWALLERTSLAPLLLAPLAALIGWVTQRRVWTPARRLAVLAIVSATTFGGLTLVYARSNLMMDYSHRFEGHAQPLVALWLGLTCAAMLRALFVLARPAAGVALLALFSSLLLIGAPLASGWKIWAQERAFITTYRLTLDSEHRLAASWLSQNLSRNATLAVYPDGGIVPLLTGFRTLDFGRLNDPYLARQARGDADEVAYFFAQRPTALSAVCYAPGDSEGASGLRAILADPRMRQYELVRRFVHPSPSVRPALCLYVERSALGKQ